ncbi:MAG: hypothetical protein ACJA2Q_002922, partial [Pseudohongiellaceae bacterium]
RFHHMAKMNCSIGVGKCAGYEDFASAQEISLF